MISMRSVLFSSVCAALVWAASPVLAQTTSAADVAALRAQVEILLARVEALEQGVSVSTQIEEEVMPVPRPEPAASWTDTVVVSGDLRYRHETINEEGLTTRHRQRIRARLGINADVSDTMSLGFGITTGGDNPISGNQTLGDGFSHKDLGLDYAFFDWRLSDELSLRGGKMRNPFYRPASHHLVYDEDLSPEGLALRFDNGRFFGNFGGFWAEERGQDDDSILIGA